MEMSYNKEIKKLKAKVEKVQKERELMATKLNEQQRITADIEKKASLLSSENNELILQVQRINLMFSEFKKNNQEIIRQMGETSNQSKEQPNIKELLTTEMEYVNHTESLIKSCKKKRTNQKYRKLLIMSWLGYPHLEKQSASKLLLRRRWFILLR